MSGVTPEPPLARRVATKLGYGSALLLAILVLVAIFSGNTTPFGIPSLEEIGAVIPPVVGFGVYLLSRLFFGVTLKTEQ